MSRLSIVIPAYNEEERIRETLSRLDAYLARQDYQTETIVVCDGCSDSTEAVVTESFPHVQVLSYTPNRGKGYAVRAGMLAATGDVRLFYDADASTPIDEVEKVWPLFEAGADVVIGSRALPESDIQVRQAWYRQNMGRIFNRFLRSVRLTRLPDTQCGFKAFTAEACGKVFSRQTIERFGFDAEILFIAEKHGLRIEQVPVRWINSPRSTVHPLVDSLRMILDTLGILRKNSAGYYD